MGLHPATIVGYTYSADTFCTSCILLVLPTGEGGAFDGWDEVTGTLPVEENLDEIAAHFGFDRADEHSFDSDDFPKVVLADHTEAGESLCGNCGVDLLD